MYRKPVCVHCQLEYKTKKTGIILVDMASYGPYKYTYADLLECPGCHHQIIWGYGDTSTHHTDPYFSTTLERHKQNGMLFECK